MNQIKTKRQKLTKQIRTQTRQQTFANQRQWREHQSLITLIPFLVDQQNPQLFDQFLESIVPEDLSILNEGLSNYINQKYEKLMTRKYYWQYLQESSKNKDQNTSQFDNDTFLVINLLRLKMKLNLSSSKQIDLIKHIIKQDNFLCQNEFKMKLAYTNYYMCHYTNMIKLIIDLSLFVQSFSDDQNQNQRPKLQYELGMLVLHQIQVFSFMKNKSNTFIQNNKNLYQIRIQFQNFQVYFLDILSKDSINIFQMSFNSHDKIKFTTFKKLQFLQKMYQICVIIYHSFQKNKQLEIIRSFRILGKIINQITYQKQNILNNQVLSVQYKNQLSQILNITISFFTEVMTQRPFKKISENDNNDQTLTIRWQFSEQIIKFLFEPLDKEPLELQTKTNFNVNVNEMQFNCLAFYILQNFHQIQYRMLIQSLKFLASAFSYSDKLIQKMFQIEVKQKNITFENTISKTMNHIANEVRLNTFWLISNISGSQTNYMYSFPFVKLIFQQQFLYWQSNISLKEQLFIIVLNYLCNLKQIQQLQNLLNYELPIHEINNEFSKQQQTSLKGKSKNMLDWIFQLLNESLYLIKNKIVDESFIQRFLYALYNLLSLQNRSDCFVRVKMQNQQMNILLNDIYNDLPKSNSQTLEMIEKILQMIDNQNKQ